MKRTMRTFFVLVILAAVLISAGCASKPVTETNTAQTDSTSAGYVADDVQSSTGSSFSLDAPAAKGQGAYHISSNHQIIDINTIDSVNTNEFAESIKRGWVCDSKNKRITGQFSYADMRNLWIEIVSPDGTKKRVSGISINEKKELIADSNNGFNFVSLMGVKNGYDMGHADYTEKWTTRPLDLSNFQQTGADPQSPEISFEISLDV